MKKKLGFEEWKKEFYPRPAAECPKKYAARDSLRKWLGLTRKNLKKFGLLMDGSYVVEGEISAYELDIDGDSCALCHTTRMCDGCLLCIARHGQPCGAEMRNESLSPFDSFTDENKPGPMIRWLRKAARLEEEKYGE